MEDGFMRWMNILRTSGPYLTRIAVYPNDVADCLNEDRFGTMVNLEYDVRTENDYLAFRDYAVQIVNKYLRSVALDRENPPTINDLMIVTEESNDALEQLIYAADGTSRRFLSLLDRCLNLTITPKNADVSCALEKSDIFNVIREFSNNLLSGYNRSDQELAESIAKACRKQVTFRFRFPGFSGALNTLHSSRQELNVVKVVEAGSGRRGSIYEFTYPYCILMDIHTHYLSETRKVCISRDRVAGEWISVVTTVERNQLDVFKESGRLAGTISELDGEYVVIHGFDDQSYYSDEAIEQFSICDTVSFMPTPDGIALDIILIDKFDDKCIW
jgi:hypothetical protein